MFGKVLVANRGEIAVRVLRTLREMNIASVAVYSEVDRAALHVRLADEAYGIGPAPSAASYLNIERILDAARRSGADAIHPGYGFLSENAAFGRACADAGIVFIGPDANVIDLMGQKTAARTRMMSAGVPVVPGAHVSSPDELAAAAASLGYPVMLKAIAGGGGKGMRRVDDPSELASAYERAQGEARSAFGDDRVYLEKMIVSPRHVEVQVLGDRHGNVVHLFERDCSIQRRHQKVVEETPTPLRVHHGAAIDDMCRVAAAAARDVGYYSAGTLEFLVAPTGEYYFLEMNTRLQVEHPITEWITGRDLVREQIRIAAGEPLGYTQDDVVARGHAIECRVYAEEPERGFLPSPGRIEALRTPSGPFVRDDSGVYEGFEIPSMYDPMISKLSTWAPTRTAAIERMRRALSEYAVLGIRSNLAFHERLLREPDFVAGVYDTGFIAAHEDALMKDSLPDEALEVLAIAATLEEGAPGADAPPTSAVWSAWRSGLISRSR